jgi:TetR/AcrR family transcriptional repressor of nem operon
MSKGERTRERVVAAAGRVFRRSGLAAGVDGVMAQADLTHGSFYRYFDSKEALAEEALKRAIDGFEAILLAELDARPDAECIEELAGRYLSRSHRDNPEQGCPLPALLADVSRMSDDRRLAIAARIARFVDRAASACGPAARPRVVAALATCVGGLLVARACRGQPLSDEVLTASRAQIAAGPAAQRSRRKR